MSGITNCSPCTDCTTTPVGPVCPAPPDYTANTCPVVVTSDCVQYVGPDDACLDIAGSGTPMTLTNLLRAVFTYLSTFLSRITSSSLSINLSGTCANLLDIELVPSAQSGNILILGNDGRPYVPPTVINMQSSKCMSWQSTGSGQNVTWTPVLDFTCISQNIDNACSAPTGVIVTGITINGAIVSFGTIVGDTYDILLNNQVLATNVISPYTIGSLTPSTNYTVTVRVNCQAGGSSETLTSFSTSPILTCNIPSGLQITSV